MWRRLFARVHPDAGGEHELFVWVSSLFEHVAGDAPDRVVDDRSRRERYASGHGGTADRIDYTAAPDRGRTFDDLTRYALTVAAEVDEPFAGVLRLLADCYGVAEYDAALYRQQHQGATYKQLAAIAYRAGMSKAQRSRWYRIAESVPLSQRHAGHILTRLQSEAT
jgi:hypothetical protein